MNHSEKERRFRRRRREEKVLVLMIITQSCKRIIFKSNIRSTFKRYAKRKYKTKRAFVFIVMPPLMRAKTKQTIASLASRALALFRAKLCSISTRKKKRRKRERETLGVVLDAFSSERTFQAFTTQAGSGRLISRRESEREYEAKKEEEGKSESEEDLLDDWVNVLKEEEEEQEEEEEALEVAVVHVLTSAYTKITRREEEDDEIVTTEREFFEAFNDALKRGSQEDNVANGSFEKHWKRLTFVRNVCSATAAMQHRVTRKAAKVVYESVFTWCFRV